MRRAAGHGVTSLAALLAICSTGCRAPGSARVIGPDGSAMVHVHCGFDQAACFRIAGELCPSGYEMKPVLSGNDGNFLVRCRSAALVSAAASCPAVAPPTPTPSPTHNLAFAAPPLAATSAAFNAAPVSTASPSGQEIDLGY